jgi:transcription antitermination factor NusG
MTAQPRYNPEIGMPDHIGTVCSDPDLLQPRDGSRPGPECPTCGQFSTRLSRGRYWCSNARCDAVFTVGGPTGLAVTGRVARQGGQPVTILPVERSRRDGARLHEGLGEEVPVSTTDMIWYTLRIEGGRETSVRDDLGDMRLATYHPIRLTWRQSRRQHWRKGGSVYTPIERNLFPGYMFLGAWAGYAVDWLAVRATKHVFEPVTTASGAPSVIPGEVIRSLIWREVAGEFRDRAPDAPMPKRHEREAFRPGDAVRLKLMCFDHADEIISIDGIRARLRDCGMMVRLESLARAG